MGDVPTDVLFNAADRRALQRVDLAGFERLLITALLFEPRLVMPDVFFFNSPLVLEHLESSPAKKTLLEEAVAQGAVVPAVREESLATFPDIVHHLRDQRIFGLLPQDGLEYVVRRLDRAGARTASWIAWPPKMAETYAELLRSVLQRDAAPRLGDIGIDPLLWHRTEPLRVEALNTAISRERSYGVRRAEVIRAAAETWDVLSPSAHLLPSERALLTSVPDLERRADLASFFTWLDTLYARNQAYRFSARTSVATNNPDVLTLLSQGNSAANSSQRRNLNLGELTVRMPAMGALARLPVARIMELRGAGTKWHLALEAHLASPSSKTAAKIEEALDDFGKLARRGMRKEALRDFGFGAAVGSGVTDMVSEASDNMLVSVGAFGAAVVRYLWMTRTTKVVDPLRTLPAASTG